MDLPAEFVAILDDPHHYSALYKKYDTTGAVTCDNCGAQCEAFMSTPKSNADLCMSCYRTFENLYVKMGKRQRVQSRLAIAATPLTTTLGPLPPSLTAPGFAFGPRNVANHTEARPNTGPKFTSGVTPTPAFGARDGVTPMPTFGTRGGAMSYTKD